MTHTLPAGRGQVGEKRRLSQDTGARLQGKSKDDPLEEASRRCGKGAQDGPEPRGHQPRRGSSGLRSGAEALDRASMANGPGVPRTERFLGCGTSSAKTRMVFSPTTSRLCTTSCASVSHLEHRA